MLKWFRERERGIKKELKRDRKRNKQKLVYAF